MAEDSQVDAGEGDSPFVPEALVSQVRFTRLELTNFLSYRSTSLDFCDFLALVGPNASGKSNAVSAIKLLREIPVYGLPVALARRGGFDQLRHRSAGRPYDPALLIGFEVDGEPESFYEIRLGALQGGRYRVKQERARLFAGGQEFRFDSDGVTVAWDDPLFDMGYPDARHFKVAPGQSALSSGAVAPYLVASVLRSIQTVEVNPAKITELQEPSSTREFEPDGSNIVSVFDNLEPARRRELVQELATIVPSIDSIDVMRLADRVTLRFRQRTEGGNREFYAKQMSDGTLRAFAILLASLQAPRRGLLVIEEPEIAIHLGALRTLVELLKSRTDSTQIVITTHSADIVDALPLTGVRVVWAEGDASHIAPISDHSMEPVRRGLITPGELLRSDSFDPVTS